MDWSTLVTALLTGLVLGTALGERRRRWRLERQLADAQRRIDTLNRVNDVMRPIYSSVAKEVGVALHDQPLYLRPGAFRIEDSVFQDWPRGIGWNPKGTYTGDPRRTRHGYRAR